MNHIAEFFRRYGYQIGWFLIGWLTLQTLHDISHGDYAGAAFCAALVVLNYVNVRR